MTAYFIIEGCKLEELEVWIEGYEGMYSLTSTGIVYSHRRGITSKELQVKYNLTESGVSRIRNKNRGLEMWKCYDEWLEMNSEESNLKKYIDNPLSVV